MPRKSPFTTSSLKIGKAPKIAIRTRKLRTRPVKEFLPVVNRPGMNGPETMVANALDELRIRYQAQATFGGGSILGGGRMDFLLPSYRIDLEYNGPFHGTTEGRAHDLLRNQIVQQQGYRVVAIQQSDLGNLKKRILQLIGRPL